MVLLKDNGVLPLGARRQSARSPWSAPPPRSLPIDSGGGSSQVLDPKPITDLAGIEPLGAPSQVSVHPGLLTVGLDDALGRASLPRSLGAGFPGGVAHAAPRDLGARRLPLRHGEPHAAERRRHDPPAERPHVVGLPIPFERSIELSPGTHGVTLAWPNGERAADRHRPVRRPPHPAGRHRGERRLDGDRRSSGSETARGSTARRSRCRATRTS